MAHIVMMWQKLRSNNRLFLSVDTNVSRSHSIYKEKYSRITRLQREEFLIGSFAFYPFWIFEVLLL